MWPREALITQKVQPYESLFNNLNQINVKYTKENLNKHRILCNNNDELAAKVLKKLVEIGLDPSDECISNTKKIRHYTIGWNTSDRIINITVGLSTYSGVGEHDNLYIIIQGQDFLDSFNRPEVVNRTQFYEGEYVVLLDEPKGLYFNQYYIYKVSQTNVALTVPNIYNSTIRCSQVSTYQYSPRSTTSWRLATQEEIAFYNAYGVPQDFRQTNNWVVDTNFRSNYRLKHNTFTDSICTKVRSLHDCFPPSKEPSTFKISKQSNYKLKELKLRSLSKLNINN